MLKGMQATNQVYDKAAQLQSAVKDRASSDAALVGAQLQAQSEKGGLGGKAADVLLNIDRKIRGLDKQETQE